MYDAEHAQSAAVDALRAQQADRWAGQAERYVTATGRTAQPDAFLRQVLPHLRASDTVLDIGAGAGRHAIFLAGLVAQVIAVERSPTMQRHLTQGIAAQQIANVALFPAGWPDADVPPADIAICSHVVYGVREIGPFLQRMDAQARRGCFLAVGFRQPSYVISPFWARIYREARLPLPGALECLNVLYQLGISAQLTLLPASRYTFADEAEALADIRWRLRLAPTPETDERIREAMAELLEREESGRLALPEQPASSALLWWLRDR